MKMTTVLMKWFLIIGLFSTFMNLFLLVQPLYLLQVFDRVIPTASKETLGMLTLIAVCLIFSMVLLEVGRKRLLVSASLRLDALMSSKLVKSALDAAPTSNLQQANLKDLVALKQLLTSKGGTALFDAPWALVFLGVIYLLHPTLGIIALIGIIGVAISSLLGMWLSRRFVEFAKNNGQQADVGLNQAFSNRELTHGLGMSDAVMERWEGSAQQSQLFQASAENSAGAMQAVSNGLRQILQITMIGVAAWLVINQQASSGILVAATILLGKVLAPVELAVSSIPAYKNAFGSLLRLIKYFKHANHAPKTFRDKSKNGGIEIKELVVRAPDASKVILKGFSFAVEPGEAFAVVGASGAGKTTLAKSIVGSLTPFSGHALIDHSPVCHWSAQERGETIGYLPQNSSLFAGTVAENIARMQEPDELRVIEAARTAGVDRLIRGLSNGYETQLGVDGAPLSAGEQQRIALARAVYGKPQIVILDEPNASIDAEGERALFVCMDLLKQRGITVIVITHRPGVLTGVDRVAVMRNGMITNISSSNQMLSAMQNVHSSAVRAKQKATAGVSHAFAN